MLVKFKSQICLRAIAKSRIKNTVFQSKALSTPYFYTNSVAMTRFLLFLFLLLSSQGFSKSSIHKDIPYLEASQKDFDPEKHVLDVYAPTQTSGHSPVLIFIHGGSWNTGNKNTYRFLGKGFAAKGIVTVIINYRLSPDVTYAPMADDCAAAVKWVHTHIAEFGGDSSRIFLSGHSAGGHLAALICNDPVYFAKQNIVHPVKGCILIDAFGLDMVSYFATSTSTKKDAWFRKTFTNNPVTWKKGSPLYYISSHTIPQNIWIGKKTYPTIQTQGKNYHQALRDAGVTAQLEEFKHKKHIGMISQFVKKSSPVYEKIIMFMQ